MFDVDLNPLERPGQERFSGRRCPRCRARIATFDGVVGSQQRFDVLE